MSGRYGLTRVMSPLADYQMGWEAIGLVWSFLNHGLE
jgi:hypothetical protein